MKRHAMLSSVLIAALSALYLYVLYLAVSPRVSNIYRAYYLERTLRTWNHGNGPAYQLGQIIDFSTDLPWLSRKGWGMYEKEGTWSDGKSAEVFFSVPIGERPSELTILARPFIAPHAGIVTQRLNVYMNGIHVGSHKFLGDEEISLKLPEKLQHATASGELIKIRFEFPDQICPRDWGISSDSRDLALFFRRMILK